MDDLIMFLVFILIAVINLVKTFVEKKARNETPPGPEAEEESVKKVPQPIQDFFDTMAEAFEMKPRPAPEWPEGYERPDYMQEMGEYEASAEGDPSETLKMEEPVREFAAAPAIAPLEATPIRVVQQNRAVTQAIPNAFAGMQGMRLPAFTILRSGTGGTLDYSLRKKADLKRAIIANVVFSRPRAYDTKFENTVVK